MKQYRYLFGPVPSRRFGRSLGIDLVPYKTCSMNCVFCQLGRTARKTVVREEFVPVGAVIDELRDWLAGGGKADFLTLAGSGEPTLHSRFGEVIEFARCNSSVRVALLTNGTTLHMAEVRKAACRADVVKVSLSAWDQESMERINRPCPDVGFDVLIQGMRTFRSEFPGELRMEVFVVAGMNDSPEEARKIAALARTVRPDLIQLNTSVRPPAEKHACAVPRARLEELANIFEPRAEIIADFKTDRTRVQADADMILAMLRRRPCTGRQIADVFSMHLNEVLKYLGVLIKEGLVKQLETGGNTFYAAEEKDWSEAAEKNSGKARVEPGDAGKGKE